MPDVVMPRLSDTMTEGVLSRWLKKEGDTVNKGDVLAEIETDKATMELEVYDAGVIERLLVAEGTEVPIGQPIAVIGDGSGAPSAPAQQSGTAAVAAESPEPERSASSAPAPAASSSTSPTIASTAESSRIRSSPLARRIAREHDIDLNALAEARPGERIVSADVEALLREQEGRPATAPTEQPTPATTPSAMGDLSSRALDSDEIPLTRMRRATARRLTESASAPHFFLTNVVNVDRLLAFRAEVNQRYAEKNVKISVTDLLIRACAVTLRDHPKINASWAQDKILQHRRIHIGVAVALEEGLIVPVVTNADAKELDVIAGETRALAERARAGKLSPEEFSGGTFTISNLGMFGIDNFTAVINPPEAAILAVGAASEDAYLRNGELSTRQIIKMTLTVDHRVLDGATAAAFLRDLKRALEEPLRIIL